MYIYLDETFNLKKGTKNQFLAIAGYSTKDPRSLAKIFIQIKKAKLPKKLSNKEIKSTDRISEKLVKPYLFSIIGRTDIVVYGNLQYKSGLPLKYFIKNKLNYDQFYEERRPNCSYSTLHRVASRDPSRWRQLGITTLSSSF